MKAKTKKLLKEIARKIAWQKKHGKTQENAQQIDKTWEELNKQEVKQNGME